uniref:MULE transposase domain-containing protein n=1 Tax=Strigamia maritima TaxID=126957 RepID=T1IMI6_STRMM
MERKTKESCIAFYGLELDPDNIISDFEIGAINAAQEVFPEANMQGCMFHLSQSIYRHVQQEGLQNRYTTDLNFQFLIKQLSALAFLPANKIKRAYLQLKQLFDNEAVELLIWFETYYVLGKLRLNGTRSQPQFPPALWSVYTRQVNSQPRTTNAVESWHHHFAKLIGTAHVGIFKMFIALQCEQADTENIIERIIAGEPRPHSRFAKTREIRISNVMASSTSLPTTLDFIRGIAHN